MWDPLVAEAILAGTDDQVRQRIKASGEQYALDVDDERYGHAFCRYLLFARWPELLHGHVPELDADQAHYNAYYWFHRFAHLYQLQHGPDAGLEQQGFQLLERMVEKVGVNLDWPTVERLWHAARR
jgi:hypothetical protein